MNPKDATLFWQRYKQFAARDLPVITGAGIGQSTLSTWRKKKIYPRADEASRIAATLNTTVEYLVTGQELERSSCSAEALEIAVCIDRLNGDGVHIIKAIVESLRFEYLRADKKTGDILQS